MDPTLMHLLMQYGQQGGMFGGHSQGQLQPMGQPQLPPMGQGDPSAQPQHRHGGFNPLMFLSPMGGLMASNPRLGMSMMSPLMGLMGAFK